MLSIGGLKSIFAPGLLAGATGTDLTLTGQLTLPWATFASGGTNTFSGGTPLNLTSATAGIFFNNAGSGTGSIESAMSAANCGSTPATAMIKIFPDNALDAADFVFSIGTAANAASVFNVAYNGTTNVNGAFAASSVASTGSMGVPAGQRLYFAGSSVGFVNNGTRTLMEGSKSTVAVGSQTTDESTLGGPVNVNVTPVNSNGNASTLISYTLPANALVNAGRGLKITAWGHVANDANAKTVSLAFGGQTIITKQLTVSIAIEVWKLTAIIVRTGTSTQQIFAEAWNEAGTTVSSVDGPTTLYQATQTSGTQNETATIVIKGVATTATTTGITQDGMIVEYF